MSLLDYYKENPDEKSERRLRQLFTVAYFIIKMGHTGLHFSYSNLRTRIHSFKKEDRWKNNKLVHLSTRKETKGRSYISHRLDDLIAKGYLEKIGRKRFSIVDLERLEDDWWKLAGKLAKQT